MKSLKFHYIGGKKVSRVWFWLHKIRYFYHNPTLFTPFSYSKEGKRNKYWYYMQVVNFFRKIAGEGEILAIGYYYVKYERPLSIEYTVGEASISRETKDNT